MILFYKLAYSFLNDCGFYDLSLLDIIRPEPYRMKRILSAIVNYAKFREEHSIDYEKYNEDCEGHFQKLNHAEMENVEFKNRIVDLKRKLEENESPEVIEGGGDGNGRKKATLKQTKAYNTKLEMELVKLKRIQDELNTERSKYRNEKLRLSEKIEDNEYLITEAKEKLLGLQNYLKTDLSLHKKVIEELNVDLSELQETVKTLTNQNRNLSVTIESFKVVENELKQLFKNLEEISKDLHNEEQSFSKLSEYNEIMDSYQLEATDLKNKIELVNTQIEAQKAKKERSDKKLAVKKSQEELKILELNEEYHKLLKEKQNFEETYNDRNNKISILENKIKLIRKDFDQEFKETERYMEKLNAHVRKYIQEMSVAMGGTDIRER